MAVIEQAFSTVVTNFPCDFFIGVLCENGQAVVAVVRARRKSSGLFFCNELIRVIHSLTMHYIR